jgi:hypothetical protein
VKVITVRREKHYYERKRYFLPDIEVSEMLTAFNLP